jgi:hypothetical protein
LPATTGRLAIVRRERASVVTAKINGDRAAAITKRDGSSFHKNYCGFAAIVLPISDCPIAEYFSEDDASGVASEAGDEDFVVFIAIFSCIATWYTPEMKIKDENLKENSERSLSISETVNTFCDSSTVRFDNRVLLKRWTSECRSQQQRNY